MNPLIAIPTHNERENLEPPAQTVLRVEVPIVFRDRMRDRLKMSRGIFLAALLLVPRLRYSSRFTATGGRGA